MTFHLWEYCVAGAAGVKKWPPDRSGGHFYRRGWKAAIDAFIAEAID